MEDNKQIYEFAVKWCDKFLDQHADFIELTDHWMADDCAALGFKMDCGHSFAEKYGDAVNRVEELERIIGNITDINLLGSAIYSRWRYFNHWAYTGAEILEPQNRAWFILALKRMALLARRNPFAFSGTLKTIRISSNCLCYGPPPEPDDEVEQHITINSGGRVWFSAYNFGRECGKYEKARRTIFNIDKTAAEKLMNAFSAYFASGYDEVFATDIGRWEMELTNTEGKTYRYCGSLCAEFNYHGIDLSDMVRDTLRMYDLYVFDGNMKPDVIKKIVIDYHKAFQIVPIAKPTEVTTRNYSEKLVIDGEAEIIEHIQCTGTGCRVSQKYEIDEGVSGFLESFDALELFSYTEGNPSDVIETPNESREYVITIDYKKNPQRIITGTFDKKGLPNDYPDFIEELLDFLCFYEERDLFNPAVFGKIKRQGKEYIFCSVTFDQGNKRYYYLTDDDSIEVGDQVVVPAGSDNHEAIVIVNSIEYYTGDNTPFPVDKMKMILRRYEKEDLLE